MNERYIGVVCSKKERKVYCLEGSGDYNKNFKGKGGDIVYIPSSCLGELILRNFKINEWDIETVLKLEVKR